MLCLQQKCLTSNYLKLSKLSLISKRGILRQAINRNANITLVLFTSTVTSKRTARVTQHL